MKAKPAPPSPLRPPSDRSEPYPSARDLLRAAAALAAVCLVAFGVHASRLGFSLDDWTMLERLRGGWSDGVRAMAQVSLERPGAIVLWPTLYAWFGIDSTPYHWLLVAQDFSAALLFYLYAGRWFGLQRLALVAASLALLTPIAPSTHHWAMSVSQQAAFSLVLGSMLLHLHWLEDGRPRFLAGAMALYGASLTLYEAAIFLPFAHACGLAVRATARGASAREAAKRAAVYGLAPFAAVAAAALGWQRLVCPWILGRPPSKGTGTSAGWILLVYRDALESYTSELWWELGIGWKALTKQFGGWMHALLAAFTLGSAVAGAAVKQRAPVNWRVAASLLAAAFLAAYLPFGLSGAYRPQVVGILSRVNHTGAFALALGLALACEFLGAAAARFGSAALERGTRALLVGSIAASFTCTTWYFAMTWVAADATQLDIINKVAAQVRGRPEVKTVVLLNAPQRIQGAEVFTAHWGFASGLRLATGRADLNGDVFIDVDRIKRHPRAGLYLYDYASGRLATPDISW
ncbi:MAG: hypothetical protein HY553_21035 [Elusimicrobia bacterium]|nr:hypothetical protein [Elusimicrobiota bacterium]